MAHALEQLTRQRQTLASIGSVVRTMKSLAALNAAPYERAATSIEVWRRTVQHGLAAFAWRMAGQVLLQPAADGRRILVVFGSDHGFCGSYNTGVARLVQQSGVAVAGSPPVLLCVGARMQAALREHGIATDQVLLPPASAEGIGRVAGELVARIEQHSRGRPLSELTVQLAFTRRAKHGGRTPQLRTLLPVPPALLQAPPRWQSPSLPDFAVPPPALLAALLRSHIFAGVFQASAEAMVTENAARLALMQQAEQAVQERLELLERQISGLRQDQVTDELMDIVIGHAQPRRGRRVPGLPSPPAA